MGIYIEYGKLNFDRLDCFWDIKRSGVKRVMQGLNHDLKTNYITKVEYDKCISLIDNMK